jgi:hypothetical protein
VKNGQAKAAQREANRLAKKFGIDFEASWLVETKWLKEWASGSFGTRANGVPVDQRNGGNGGRGTRACACA